MNRIAELRKRNKVSQAKLGKLVGAAQNTVSQWENGLREPDTDTLHALADFFNVTIDYLLGRDSEQKNNPDAAGTGDDEIYSILSELTPENQEKLLELARMYRASQQRPEDN